MLQEREARIETKRKMERSSMVFAFGSSTPRMLEPPDSGSTYWASRRYTFIFFSLSIGYYLCIVKLQVVKHNAVVFLECFCSIRSR